jgi:hypothetical protein
LDELVHFVRLALPILALDSPDGVDVWFLNETEGRAGPVVVKCVHAFDQIAYLLRTCGGLTPLIETLGSVLSTYRQYAEEEGVHILVTTDGAPNQGPAQGHALLHRMLANRLNPGKSVVNFLVCTDNDKEVAYLEYLESIDRDCPNVDEVDDYDTERRQILASGRVKTFSVGDYVVKAIIGGARADVDQLDETAALSHPAPCREVQGCCNIV